MNRMKPHMFNTLNVRGQGMLTGQGDLSKANRMMVIVALLMMIIMTILMRKLAKVIFENHHVAYLIIGGEIFVVCFSFVCPLAGNRPSF